MFSNIIIGFVFAIGVGGWVYSKTQHQTGGNTQTSLMAAAGAGFFGFLVIVILLGLIF